MLRNRSIFFMMYVKCNKKRQVTYSAPLNRLPLLPSDPGGFARSWSYKTCPTQRYIIIPILKLKIKLNHKKERRRIFVRACFCN